MSITNSYLMRKLLVMFLLALGVLTTVAQPAETSYEKWWAQQSDRIEEAYPGVTVDLPAYKLELLIALAHYPELQGVTIHVKAKSLKTTMAARPLLFSATKRQGKRKYQILVNFSNKAEINVNELSFKARVGVFAHELAHIVDYEQKSAGRIMLDGLSYWNKNFRRTFERATDLRTIEHGLGCELLLFSTYVLTESKASDKYKAYKERIYMHPKEIIAEMQRTNDYDG